jgi:hypothetical protein
MCRCPIHWERARKQLKDTVAKRGVKATTWNTTGTTERRTAIHSEKIISMIIAEVFKVSS